MREYKVGDKVMVEGKEAEIIYIAYDGCRRKMYGVQGSRKDYYAKDFETRAFLKVSRITDDIKLPERSTKHSAGYDFTAIEDVIVPPYKFGDNPFMIATGVKVQMMNDEFLMLVNRSSNPKKKKLVIPASVGIIDCDYYNNEDNEGEMYFGFINVSNEPVEIKKGEKLGQGIFMKYYTTNDDNADGERTGGFGSTGK